MAMPQHGSLTAPLIVDEKEPNLSHGDLESNHTGYSQGTTSSLKTIVNGLNALSGSALIYALLSFHAGLSLSDFIESFVNLKFSMIYPFGANPI